MNRRFNKAVRRLAPLFAAGMLLQASGCTTDLQQGLAGLVTSVATQAISNGFFSLFNLV